MSQIPLNDWSLNPNVVSGVQLAEILNRFELAMLSAQSGTTAPVVFQVGSFWLDNTDANAYKLMIYTSVGWSEYLRFNPTTGAIITSGVSVPVTKVNTKVGEVLVQELYDRNGTPGIIATTTANGVNLVVNQDADPAANLAATVGRISFNTTTNRFEGRNSTTWTSLGGGSYTSYANEVIANNGTISSNILTGFQHRLISSAAAINISNVPFGNPGTLWPSGTVITIENTGTFVISFVDGSGSAQGLVTADTIDVEAKTTISFIYDSTAARWYPLGGSGSGGGKYLTYTTEVLVNGGTVTNLPNKGFQYRPISAASAITLSTTPFGNTATTKDGVVITLQNLGTFSITIPVNNAANGMVFKSNVVLNQYDSVSLLWSIALQRWEVISSGANSGYIANNQTVVAAGNISLINAPFQTITLTAVTPVTLAANAFTIPASFPDKAQVRVIGSSDTNTVKINYSPTQCILFGDHILKQYFCLDLEYDKTTGLLMQTNKNY
jgi:hypothetical protein